MPTQYDTPTDTADRAVGLQFLRAADQLGIEKVLDGLIAILDQERDLLEDATLTQFGSFTRQKLQLLMHLNRVTLACKNTALPSHIEEKLKDARHRLDENAGILKHRMDAIREVAALISEEIRDAESDGTYSVARRGGDGYLR